jgi:hypothetical protein
MLLTLLHSLVLLAKEANTTTSVCRCVTSVSRMVQKLARGHTRFACEPNVCPRSLYQCVKLVMSFQFAFHCYQEAINRSQENS